VEKEWGKSGERVGKGWGIPGSTPRITHLKRAVLTCSLEWLGLGDEMTVVINQGGSTDRLLGVNQLGRDVLSRVIHGARMPLIVVAATLGNEEPLAWHWG